MGQMSEQQHSARRDALRQYVLGLGIGGLCALYGLYGLVTRTAFLPVLKGGPSVLRGLSALDLAAGYLSGGLYLVLRFYLHRRCRSEAIRRQVYAAEVVLLAVFIGALVWLLLTVGSVGEGRF